MADRVARQKNREQDARLDAIDAWKPGMDAELDELAARVDVLEAIRLVNEGAITAQAQDLAKLAARVDSVSARVTALEQPTPEPEPEPEPPKGEWRTLIDLSRIANWKNTLISAPGASITEGPFQGKHAIRIQKPRPGERCELHHMDDRLTEGGEFLYSWWLWIPGSVNLTTEPDWSISQAHGDNGAGYGGGTKITRDDRLIVSVKGGERLSASGSQRYEYELNGKGEGRVEGPDEFGRIERDRWHLIRYHAKWSTEWDGFVRCQLDNGPVLRVEDVPTFSKISDSQMHRLGWYEGNGKHGPLDMYVAEAKIEVPADG